jgi:hypothetical protein
MMMNFSPSSVSDAGIMDANAESPPPASEVEIELTYDRAKDDAAPTPTMMANGHHPPTQDDDDDDDDDGHSRIQGGREGDKKKKKSWPSLAGGVVFVAGAAAGAGIATGVSNSRLAYVQPSEIQQAMQKHKGTTKAGKSSCPLEPTTGVKCGNVYDSTAGDEAVVILGQNLLCDEDTALADGSRNGALTLIGKGAVLDCQGYTISQTTIDATGIDKGSAAAFDCDIFPGNDAERLRMKQKCGLFNVYGVLLEDGATMRNCNIQKFWGGASIVNGGKIEGTEFSLNRRVVNLSSRAANTVSKISNR